MNSLHSVLRQFHHEEAGATATEYIVLLILIACFVIGVTKVFGATVSTKFDVATDVVRRELTF